MISWDLAWKRSSEARARYPWLLNKKQSDFRSMVYNLRFSDVAPGTVNGPTLQTFPAGAFVLEIQAAAFHPLIVKENQYYADGAASPQDVTYDRGPTPTPGNRDLFSIDVQYTNDEIITAGGPIIAAALMGAGDTSQFPPREIVIDPSQGLLVRAKNEITFALIDGSDAPEGETSITLPLTIDVVFKCMVPRAAG